MENNKHRKHINTLIVVTSILAFVTGLIIFIYLELININWLGGSGGPDLHERIQGSLIFALCALIYYTIFHVIIMKWLKTGLEISKRKMKLFYMISAVLIFVIVMFYTFGETVEKYLDKLESIKYENEAKTRQLYYNGILETEYEFRGILGMTKSETWYEFNKLSSVNKTDIEYLLSIIKPVDDLNIVISLNWNKYKSKIQVKYDKDRKFISVIGSSSDKEAVKVVSEFDGIERLPVINSVRAESRGLRNVNGAILDDFRSNEETISKNDGIIYLYFLIDNRGVEQSDIQYIANTLNLTHYPDEKFYVSIIKKSDNREELIASFKTDGKYSFPKKIEEIRH